MKVSELKAIIDEVEELLAAAAATKPAEDFAALSELLSEAEDLSVDEFLAELRAAYAPKPRKSANDNAPGVNDVIVRKYTERLSSMKGVQDEGAVGALIDDLRGDKRVSKADANAIQHRFIGGREAWPSKKAAVDAIVDHLRFVQNEAARIDRDRSFRPW
ncbi:MAG: hypothetical protein AAFR60_07805 [Pseudomonadota bacterium]